MRRIKSSCVLLGILALCSCAFSLDPWLRIGQYAHTAWTSRDGFSTGNIFSMAQTPDVYFWLGGESGMFRFDGVHAVPWQPPAGQHLRDKTIYELKQTGLRGDGKGQPESPARHSPKINARVGDALVRDLKFTHLTTNDGLSQGYVVAILQDRRGFMWFATRNGLDRYDGNAFVVYKNNPDDAASLSSNFLQDLIEDDHGYLWLATKTGVDKFDPTTERFTHYFHDPNNPNSLGGASVKSIAEDRHGYFWFGTEDSGLEKLDATTGKFSHFRNDSHGQFVGRITQVIADSRDDIWFVGERGLFHLNQTGEITQPRTTRGVLSAASVCEDELGNLWMLVDSPTSGLVKYDRRAERLTPYPLGARTAGALPSTTNGGSANGILAPDGQNGFWVPCNLGLCYFDRQTERYTYRFQHEESNPDSLDSNAVMSVYQDKGGVLWVGTENSGLNVLNFRQKQFGLYQHRPGSPDSLLPGRVKAIHQDSNAVLWVGLFPRALDRIDRKTGQITHYLPKRAEERTLGQGTNVSTIYKDAAGYLWVGGGGGGVDRLDERTGRFKHYRHNADHPNSLISNNVYTIYADRNGHVWVGQEGGLSRYEPATDGFTNYLPISNNPTIFANTIWVIYQDRSGTLWAGTWGGALIRFDDKTKAFVSYAPDSHDRGRLQGGGINTIHEDRTGTLWVGTFDGLYRYNRANETFTRYTERQGLPTSTVRCILEDATGKLWLSTDRGISRFDPQSETFRNYDVSDGLQSNEFSTGCYQGSNGELFFGGSNGFNAFFPEKVQDNPYVPPVALTSFRIFNKPVPIGGKSVLSSAVAYVDSLNLSYRDSVFSFEFAALSYANSHKNRYRYKLENFDPAWNEVGSQQRIATYTNLDSGRYVFRVQGSNSDGVWNAQGVSLRISITPPWWKTTWFGAICAAAVLILLWAAYQLRVQQLHQQFSMTLEARVGERTRIARDLHDTLLQSFHGVLLFLQNGIHLMREHPSEGMKTLETAVELAEQAIIEGREAVQGLRVSTVERNDLALALKTFGGEIAATDSNSQQPEFSVQVEGIPRDLHPILRDGVFRITGEGMRNAFRHADANQIEVEILYDERQLRVRIRDDGKGIDPKLLSNHGPEGHFGLRGMRERAKLIGGKLNVWSELDSGTEVELSIPASRAYTAPGDVRHSWLADKFAKLSGNDTELKS